MQRAGILKQNEYFTFTSTNTYNIKNCYSW